MKLYFFYVFFYLGEAISLSDQIIVLTKRPAKIKNIYEMDFEKDLLPTSRRRSDKFNLYYDKIWKEIDNNV